MTTILGFDILHYSINHKSLYKYMPERKTIRQFKEKGELPARLSNIGNPEKSINKFLKSEQNPESPVKQFMDRGGNFLRSERDKKIEEVKQEAEQTYEVKEEVVESTPPQVEPEKVVEKKEKRNGILKLIGKVGNIFKNKHLFVSLGLLTMAGSAKASNVNSAEKEFANNENTIDKITTNGGGERKVKEVPPGYVKSHTVGSKTYYKKIAGGGELKIAKPGSGKESKEYEDWLKNLLKSGKASPEQLAQMKYISTGAIEKYREYYTPPAEDIVYTEPEENKESNPFYAYAEEGESVYGPDQHLIAIICDEIRKTDSITESGNINTSKPEHKILIRMVDNMGKPTGECIETTVSKYQTVFGTGTHVKNMQLLEEWKTKTKAEMAKGKSTYVATAEDFASNK